MFPIVKVSLIFTYPYPGNIEKFNNKLMLAKNNINYYVIDLFLAL